MKNIAVFFGGDSVEHDVSVITGVLTANSLDKEKFCAYPILVTHDGEWFTGEQLKDVDNYKNLDFKRLSQVTFKAGDNVLCALKKNKLKPLATIAVAINCMHGERGEDGSLAGFLNMCKIPVCSPDILPSSVSIDKIATKYFLKGLGIKTVPYLSTTGKIDKSEVQRKLGYPIIVKPNRLGSSIGIEKVDSADKLDDAVFSALRYGEKAIIEKCLTDFIEINCAVYENSNGDLVVSECERPLGYDNILTFDDKYKNGQREYPANIPIEISEKIKSISKKVYLTLGFSGIIRIDFMISNGEIYLNEINSVPGSLAYYLFCTTLKDFSGLLTDLISGAEKRFSALSTVNKKFSSSILFSVGNKGAKRL